MIRTTAVPRPVRIGTALLGVAGVVTLAGCSGGNADAAAPAASASAPAASSAPSGSATTDSSSGAPESVETVDVTLTIAGDTVTDVTVTGDPQAAESRRYQSEFIGGIKDEVVGKKVDEISVSKVAGSSLTSGGFMKALDTIKSEAKA